MKSVMITGCAGFIGSHVTEVFLEAGYNIIGVDAMTYASSIKNMNNLKMRSVYDNPPADMKDTLQETILSYGVAAAS